MITLMIILAIAVAAVITLFTGGLAFIIAFGDLIFGALVLWWIIRYFIKKKKEKKE